MVFTCRRDGSVLSRFPSSSPYSLLQSSPPSPPSSPSSSSSVLRAFSVLFEVRIQFCPRAFNSFDYCRGEFMTLHQLKRFFYFFLFLSGSRLMKMLFNSSRGFVMTCFSKHNFNCCPVIKFLVLFE